MTRPQYPLPNWEIVNVDTQRFPVPGGWLYRTIIHSPVSAPQVAMVFVPDVSLEDDA